MTVSHHELDVGGKMVFEYGLSLAFPTDSTTSTVVMFTLEIKLHSGPSPPLRHDYLLQVSSRVDAEV